MRKFLVITKNGKEVVTEFMTEKDFDKDSMYEHYVQLEEKDIHGEDLNRKMEHMSMVLIEIHPQYDLEAF